MKRMDLERLAPGIEAEVIRALHDPLLSQGGSLPTDAAKLTVVKLSPDEVAFLQNRAQVYQRFLASSLGAEVEVTIGMILELLVMQFMRQSDQGPVLSHWREE